MKNQRQTLNTTSSMCCSVLNKKKCGLALKHAKQQLLQDGLAASMENISFKFERNIKSQ